LLAYRGEPQVWENLTDVIEPGKLESDAILKIVPPDNNIPAEVYTYPIVLALAVRPDGKIAAGAFSLENIAQRVLADVFGSEKTASFLIVDQEENLLFHAGNPAHEETLTNHTGVKEALDGTYGASYIDIHGQELVVTYTPILPVMWALVIEEPWETVASSLLRVTENAPLVMVPALLMVLLALWFGIRQIVLPLKALEGKAADLGWGKFSTIEEPVGGITEIRRLQTELIHLAHKVQTAQQGMRGYIAAMTSGQEDERRRLARELHDDTLQALIALNQRLQLSLLTVESDIHRESMVEIQELTRQTIENLRRITRALRPIYLEDLGLAASLEMLARETREMVELEVVFKVSSTQRRLKPDEELALYRITQEALSNIVRHAQASWCQVGLEFEDHQVCLTIQDDGKGFNLSESPAELAHKGHFGLLGMQERAELMDAKINIQTSPEAGTRIQITL